MTTTDRTSPRPGAVLAAIARTAARLCEAGDAVIFQVEGDGLCVVAKHGKLPSRHRLSEIFPLSRDMVVGRAVLERRTVHVRDLLSAARHQFKGSVALHRGSVRTMLVTPLLRGRVVLGAIIIRRTKVRPFTAKQVALLRTFADQAAMAIENVRLFKELEARNGELTRTLEQQTATGEILRVISSSPTDVQPVFEAIVRNASRLCGGEYAIVIRYDGGMMHLAAQHNPRPGAAEPVAQLFPRAPGRGSSPGRAILNRSPVHIPDVLADPEYAPDIVRAAGLRGVLSMPMCREDKVIGAISVSREKPGPFDESQIELLKVFADQAVIAIENVRLFKELDEKNRALTEAHAQVTEALEQQTATGEILRVISSSPTNIQPVFDIIAESAVRLCESYDAAVWRRDGDRLLLVAHRGPIPMGRIGDFSLSVAGTVAGRSMLEGRTIHVDDVTAEDDRFPETREHARAMGFRTVLTIPLMREGVGIGSISLRRTEVHLFTERQVELLKTFADQAVIAIENVRLFKELEARTADLTRSVEQLTALGEVGRAVSSTLDLETVLTTIVSRAVELSGLDGGVVFEYDEGTCEFVQRAQTETGGALAEVRRTTRIRKGEGVLGRTAITLEPIQVHDITVPGAYEGRLRENLVGSGIRAVLAVPMVHQGQLIGCLGVTRNRPGEFPSETIELLRTFATQSALAIQNARLFQEIADKSRQLEATSRHKSEFLANMSHELRTPLNAVIGFSEVLIQRMFGELNDKQDEYLKDIYASGQHLLSLINDVLDLSKIEAGRMELAPAPFHLPTALENAVTLVKERAARHGIALQFDLDPQLGELVGDERKVKQVLLNLLSNAVKFTPEGGRISLKASRRDDVVEIAVTDTGIGIAPEDQGAIFEEFRQVGRDETRKQEGTGLGLTLAKKFVELHGGRIWVDSKLGRGSTFTFTLPMS